MSKTIALKPHLSEKTYALSEKRVYVFSVPLDVNKHTVARAVEAQFEVKVTEVNIVNIAGKAKRIVSLTGKRSVNANGKRNDIKKAYVTLAEGNSLPFFAAVDEAAEQDQATQEKLDKVAAKAADKEAKPARRGIRRAKKEEDK
ncbi:MAG: rplW [Candidatus Saccharibacteria bacterium]|nr:rplW [Candidatus Saccharibacteria bacterium]